MDQYNHVLNELNEIIDGPDHTINGMGQVKNIVSKMLPTISCQQCYSDNINILQDIVNLVEMSEFDKQNYKSIIDTAADNIFSTSDITAELTGYDHVDARQLCLLMSFITIIYQLPDINNLPEDMLSNIISVCHHNAEDFNDF